MGFRDINFKSMGIFRILLGIFLGVSFARQLPFITDFYTNQGMAPLENLALAQVIDHPLFQAVFITVHVMAIAAFTLGYRTRLATIVLLLTYACLYWRGFIFLSRIDTTVRLLLLWSVFLPLGRYWSIDALHDKAPPDRSYPFFPVFAVRAQLAMIYLFSGLYKLAGKSWRDGTAVTQSLTDNSVGATPAAKWLVQNFGDWLWLPTYGIIIFQLAFSILIYMPWHNNWFRGFALLTAAAMHVSFIFFLRVDAFPYISLIYLVLLVPDSWWNGVPRTRKPHGPETGLNKPAQWLCGFLLAFALVYNVMTVPWASVVQGGETARVHKTYVPEWLKTAAAFLQVQQEWSIFAPNPPAWQRRYEVKGYLRSGEAIDLRERLPHQLFSIDDDGYRTVYGRSYMYYYLVRLNPYDDKVLVQNFQNYLCRAANRDVSLPKVIYVRYHAYETPASASFQWPGNVKPFYSRDYNCP